MNTFKDVIGHEEIVNHLQNAMKTNKVSHAYIFQGEDGIGKNFVANIFAAALYVMNMESIHVPNVNPAYKQFQQINQIFEKSLMRKRVLV